MDEMTREEVDIAIGELDDAEREYLKLLISRVIRCFVDDDHEAVPLGPLLLDLGRHVLDAVNVADGSAAVFLDNQSHP